MNRRELKRLDQELDEYIESLVAGMGRTERRAAMGHYITGLLLDGERKSIEPMAARLVDSEDEIEGMRQRLQQAVSVAEWSEGEMLRRLAVKLDSELPGVEALVVDDTGFPKKGEHSVGVQRQYSGTLGRIDNCQVAVSLHVAGERGSGCIGFGLFLPEIWASDGARRKAVGVPDNVEHRTKMAISLSQIDAALAAGVRRHVVLADAGYGDSTEYRDALRTRGLNYVTGVYGELVVWRAESKPQIPSKPAPKMWRTRYVDARHPPIRIAALASTLKYKNVKWREGSRGWQSSRFAATRIRPAHRHTTGAPPGDEQWLFCEWPDGEKAPTKYWLSSLPAATSIRSLVRFAKLRWRVERDYQEMKQEVGLDHFEGRTWRGFHHHAALCAVAHGFLALKRALFPSEDDEVDASDGPSSPAGGARAAGRHLSALPPPDQRSGTADGTVADVIEWY